MPKAISTTNINELTKALKQRLAAQHITANEDTPLSQSKLTQLGGTAISIANQLAGEFGFLTWRQMSNHLQAGEWSSGAFMAYIKASELEARAEEAKAAGGDVGGWTKVLSREFKQSKRA